MIFVFLACYIILAAVTTLPFRISSAESKREREELRKAKRS